MQELARQLEAAQQVRDSMHLVEHIKKCVAWGVVAIDRATIAKLDNQLEFEQPTMAQEVCRSLLCNSIVHGNVLALVGASRAWHWMCGIAGDSPTAVSALQAQEGVDRATREYEEEQAQHDRQVRRYPTRL